MALADYRAKRNFKHTPEPKGKAKPAAGGLRFVVQKHRATRLHYDFRLELDGVLKSWAVPRGPSLNPNDKRLAMMVEDHPFDYRSFEGVIPEGNYGAGEVIVWDEGVYMPLEGDDPQLLRDGLAKGDLKFVLLGSKLKGAYALVRIKNRDEDNSWLLIKKADEFASEADITRQDRSVLSDRRVEDLAQTAVAAAPTSQPRFIKPMLASLTSAVEDKPDWSYEIKWDGYRIIAVLDQGKAQLLSRNEQDYTAKFAPVAAELAKLKQSAVLDGEVVVVDQEGNGRFQLLQNYQRSGEGQLVYYVFDLLHLNGHDTLELPLRERQELLAQLLPKSRIIKLSQGIVGQGSALLAEAKRQQLEGIIAKDLTSRYSPGQRSQRWLKYKAKLRQEAVIAGFTEPKGSRKLLGALILATYQDGELTYIGHTGGGFNQQNIEEVYARLKPLERKTAPFAQPPKTNAPVRWVTPKLLCEVEFAEWTAEGHMRQPIFLGLRDDKPAATVVKEEQTANPASKVELKHLDKLYWPKEGYTKGDLLAYYQAVGELMLPYLLDRPHSLNRHPDGIEGESFYQKDMTGKAPAWLKTFKVESESEDRDVRYLVCDGMDGLLYMANLGCIEINPWLSRTKRPEHPDWCVLDLDPEDIEFGAVVKTAQAIHRLLERIGVESFVKTSGATGLHIFVPLAAKHTYEQSKQFAQIVANLVHAQLPDITSVERRPVKRQQRVYIDFLQNRRGQTLAAPYSVRPRPGAPVATPLKWSEVTAKLDPTRYTIKTTAKRIDKVGNLWQPLLTAQIDLKSALGQLTKEM